MAGLLRSQFSSSGAGLLRAQFGAVAPAGVLGSVILLTTGGGTDGRGFLYNDVLPGDEAKRFTFIITRAPTLGTLVTNPDGTFVYTPFDYANAADTFEYQGFADGVSYGTAEVEVGTPAVVLGGAADVLQWVDAGGGALFSLALGGVADALQWVDAGGDALFGASLGGAADVLQWVDAGGSIGLPSAWPARGVRAVVGWGGVDPDPVKIFEQYSGDEEFYEADFESKYLPQLQDDAATLTAFVAPAGLVAAPRVPVGSSLGGNGIVMFRVTEPPVGTHELQLQIRSTGGRTKTCVVRIKVDR